MQSTDQQLQKIMKRAELIKNRRRKKRRVLIDGISSFVFAILLIITSVSIPEIKSISAENSSANYGSLILGSPYFAYIMITVLAFVLGVSIALLCIHLKALRAQEDPRS